MPRLLRTTPNGIGQYFDGQMEIVNGRPTITGKLVREVCASTCTHCGAITQFASMRKFHEHCDICRGCMRPICLRCVGRPCRPQEKEAERQEREQRIHGRIVRDAWGCY
jgi:hypothetical protein